MRGPARWLGLALAVLFLGLLAFGLTRDARELPSAMVGREAPSFALESLTRDTLRLAELEREVVVLNFWASWCLPCRDEHPVLMRAQEEYGSQGVRVVGVVYQDSRANARRFLEELGWGWRSVLDPGSRTAIDYGVYGVPETYFIGRDGRVGRRHVGPVTWELVRGTVDSLLAVSTGAGAGEPGGVGGDR